MGRTRHGGGTARRLTGHRNFGELANAGSPCSGENMNEKTELENFIEAYITRINCGEEFSIRSVLKDIAEKIRSLNPTAPASLVEGVRLIAGSSMVSERASEALHELADSYRPAPSSDEGLRDKERADMFEAKYYELAKKLLHPAPAKSADRCAELVERLRDLADKHGKVCSATGTCCDIARQDVAGEIYAILDEFSKDADGKEGR